MSRAQRGLRPLQAPEVSPVTCHPSMPLCARGLPQVTPLSYPLGFCTARCDDPVQKALNKSGTPEHDLRRLTRRWLRAGATVGVQTHIRAPSCEEAWARNKVKNSCARHGRVGQGAWRRAPQERGRDTDTRVLDKQPSRVALLWKARPSMGARVASAGCSLHNAAVRAQLPVSQCGPVPARLTSQGGCIQTQ